MSLRLAQAVDNMNKEQMSNAKAEAQNQIVRMEAMSNALIQEEAILRKLKMDSGNLNNLKNLIDRVNNDQVRIGKVTDNPNTTGPKNTMIQITGMLSTNMTDLYNRAKLQNDSLDKAIASREAQVKALRDQIAQLRKGIVTMKGDFVKETDELIQDIRNTFGNR